MKFFTRKLRKVEPLEVFKYAHVPPDFLKSVKLSRRTISWAEELSLLMQSHGSFWIKPSRPETFVLAESLGFKRNAEVLDIPLKLKKLVALARADPDASIARNFASNPEVFIPHFTLIDFVRVIIFYAGFCKDRDDFRLERFPLVHFEADSSFSDAHAADRATAILLLFASVIRQGKDGPDYIGYRAEIYNNVLKRDPAHQAHKQLARPGLNAKALEAIIVRRSELLGKAPARVPTEGISMIFPFRLSDSSYLFDELFAYFAVKVMSDRLTDGVAVFDSKLFNGFSPVDLLPGARELLAETTNVKFSTDLLFLNLQSCYPSEQIDGFPPPAFSLFFDDPVGQSPYMDIAQAKALEVHNQLVSLS